MQWVARQARAATRNAVGFAMVTVVALALIAGGVGTAWSQGMMGMGRMETPGATEARTLLDYLLDHAMVPATPEQLARGPADARAVFQSRCSRCHALPSLSMHAPEQWPGIVARMQANMQLMGKATLTAEQQEAVVRFLQTASRSAAN